MEEIIIYTVEEIAQLFKTTNLVIEEEIKKGKLCAFKVGTEWRITKESLRHFIEKATSQERESNNLVDKLVDLNIKAIEPFEYKWPDSSIEKYPEAYEGIAKNKYGNYEIKIGVGNRNAAGKNRKRVVVFVNGRPTVEFVGTDNFEKDGLTASLITLPNRKRLTSRQVVPIEYKQFNVARYNSLVTGPHAMSTMAVIAKIDDYHTMIAHALIRASYRGE